MSRTRRWTAVGIVGVLALALGGLLWRSWNTAAPTTPPTTAALAVITTTAPPATTSMTTPSPTTTSADQRIAEVEAILADVWFGWFDAIYRKDADALWNVVATSSKRETAISAMDSLRFDEAPSLSATQLSVDQILLDRSDCLVVQADVAATFVDPDAATQSVYVLWPVPRYGWRLASSWVYANDLWQADCDEVTRESTP